MKGLLQHRRILAAFVTIWILFAIQAPWSTLWDRDEPRFAQAAVEMVTSGNFLVATFNGEPRLHKPILSTWLMAISTFVFGAGEMAARWWSSLGIALAAFVTLLVGRRVAGDSVGLWALAIFATSPLVAVEGLAATADAVLLATTTAACLLVVTAIESNELSWRRMLLLGLAIGLGALIKGPVAPLIPILVLVGSIGMARWTGTIPSSSMFRTSIELVVALFLGAGLFLLWAVPANQATGGELWRVGFVHHVIERALSPFEGHGGHFVLSLPYYLPVVIVGFAPWILFLPAALSALFRTDLMPSRRRTLLLAWAATPVVFFSLIATKLPHYVLSIWPALAVIVAAFVVHFSSQPLDETSTRWLRRGAGLHAILLVILCGSLAGAASVLRTVTAPLLVTATVAAATGVIAISAAFRAQVHKAAVTCAAGTLATQMLLTCWLLPVLDAVKPVPPVAAAIRAVTDDQVPVATWAFSEPSLIYYLGRWPVTELAGSQAAIEWLRKPEPGVLVTTRSALNGMLHLNPQLQFNEIASSEGFNVANGRVVELVGIMRSAGDENLAGGERPYPP